MLDYTNAYRVCLSAHSRAAPLTARQKYTVYRKMPMLVTRTERLLAIDGGYIHVRFHAPFLAPPH